MSRTTGLKRASGPASAHWPLYLLLDTLRRQGWGPLAGRPWKGLRAVLQGLAARLPYKAAQGRTTIEQIASAAGYGLRWTRQMLTDLEDLGLIEWQRGGVRYGRPVASWFRINKTMLAELIDAAREQRTAEIIAWAAKTRARLNQIRSIRLIKAKPTPRPARPAAHGPTRDRRTRRSAHAALAASPSPKRGDPRGLHPSSTTAEAVLPPGLTGSALARAVLDNLGLR